jgi:hypothetical protein
MSSKARKYTGLWGDIQPETNAFVRVFVFGDFSPDIQSKHKERLAHIPLA